jgi:DNA-binding NtrC family response regulator
MPVEIGPLTVLIADDERASRDVLHKAVLAAERHVEIAKDGDEAVALLERDTFDVVITDLNMPGVGGLEVFRHAIRTNPFSQVVFITGYGSIEMVMGAIQAGAYDFVAKPFKLAEIQLVVRNACEKVMLLREVRRLRGEQSGIEMREGGRREYIPTSSTVARAVGNAAVVREYARAARSGSMEATDLTAGEGDVGEPHR